MMKKVVILIPCYNEELTIATVINNFKKELPNASIYVYDNNSTDRTAEIAHNNGAIVKREYRQGKGNVIRSMFREIEADIYVMVDGDDTYPSECITSMILPVEMGSADMVVGDRHSNGTYAQQNKRYFHNIGNHLVKIIINKLFNSSLKDIMSGYRVFNRTFVKSIPILSSGFQVETEMTLHALDKRFLIKEISIEYRDRPEGSYSKLNTIKDGIKVIKTIFWVFKDFKPLLFFTVLSLMLFVIGIIIGIPVINEFMTNHFILKIPSAILATGLIILSTLSFTCGLILNTTVKQHRENYEIMLNFFCNRYDA